MQAAQQAASWLRRHPEAALQIQLAEAPDDVTATGALVRFMSWVATSGPDCHGICSAVRGAARPGVPASHQRSLLGRS